PTIFAIRNSIHRPNFSAYAIPTAVIQLLIGNACHCAAQAIYESWIDAARTKLKVITDMTDDLRISYLESLAHTYGLTESADHWPAMVKIKHDLDVRLPNGEVLRHVILSREQ